MESQSERDPYAVYPMVEEGDASGRVAAVYADALRRLPFIPSFLKSVAVCPPYLVLAWEQASSVVDARAFSEAKTTLMTAARGTGPAPRVSERATDVLRTVADPTAQMILLAFGLDAALSGDLVGAPATGRLGTDATPDLSAHRPAPLDPTTFARVRAAMDTPIVNTVWRNLSSAGEFDSSWPELERVLLEARDASVMLQDVAHQLTMRLPWKRVASPAALEAAGIGDALPGMRSVLQAYMKTLPRLLALVARV